MSQLSLFTNGTDILTGKRIATEEEVVEWLISKGYRVTRGAKTRVPDPDERKRLSKQCRDLLGLFHERGDAGVWNNEMAARMLKYTGRVSELRGAGYRIEIVERNGPLRRYVLTSGETR